MKTQLDSEGSRRTIYSQPVFPAAFLAVYARDVYVSEYSKSNAISAKAAAWNMSLTSIIS